jgi:2-polyprenyl-6-methoxyphenol hydroxylase-like FAD-dependent oxidoreductase
VVRWDVTTVRRDDETWSTGGAPDLSAVARATLNRLLWTACADAGVILRERVAPPLSALSASHDVVVFAGGVGSSCDHHPGFEVRTRNVGPQYSWLGLDEAVGGLTFQARPTPDGLCMAHAYPYADGASTFLVEAPRALTAAAVEEVFRVRVRTPGPRDALTWRRFRERHVRPWTSGNVVLVGDAAHTAHYSVGHGTHLAFSDAAVLADMLLAESVPATALRGYERLRRPAVERTQAQGRASSEWFSHAEAALDLPISRFAVSLLTRGGRLDKCA